MKVSKENRKELKDRLTNIIEAKTEELFLVERNKFIEYYSMKEHYNRFVLYMQRTWLRNEYGKKTHFPSNLCGRRHVCQDLT
jgi:hypothetical protein